MTKQTPETGLFTDLPINKELLSILTKKGFTVPTPIQHQVIPGGLEGQDIIGVAQTGTGKTLAFGIPLLQRVLDSGRQGLILVPTRELALQVDEALRQIGSSLGLKTAVVIGGVPQFRQVKALKRNPHVVVATPGRLDDLMQQKKYFLDKISVITLDEADRMLDVGFLPQIKHILKTSPQDRQTLLFSATMPDSISSLANEFMRTPLRIEIAPQGTSSENIEQEVFVVNHEDKMRLLEELLYDYKDATTLIFSRTKYGAKRIARQIKKMGHTATEIHSNRTQNQRRVALDGFSKGKFRIMVATDIAARGIDVKDISLVINYDLPDSSEDYVHRIGRTGRAGRSGKAISFAMGDQKWDIKKIERIIHKALPIATHPKLPEVALKDGGPKRKSGGGRSSRRGGGGGRYSRGGGNSRKSSYGKRKSGGYRGKSRSFKK